MIMEAHISKNAQAVYNKIGNKIKSEITKGSNIMRLVNEPFFILTVEYYATTRKYYGRVFNI